MVEPLPKREQRDTGMDITNSTIKTVRVTPSEFRQLAAHPWEYVLTPNDDTQTDMFITPTVEDLSFLQELGITTNSLDSFHVVLCPSEMEHYNKLDGFVNGFTLDLTVNEEAFNNGFRPTAVVAQAENGRHMIFCLSNSRCNISQTMTVLANCPCAPA